MSRRALLALPAFALGGCGALVGLEDHELAPPPDAAASDACGPCAPGYVCVDGRCGNEVAEVAASGTHACAVLRGGELWCWGKSQLGALGVDARTTPERCGAYACRPAPAKVERLPPVVHVALTEDASCAVANDGQVWCWGKSARGALAHDPSLDPACARQATGDAGPTATDACSPDPVRVSLPAGLTAVQLVAGGEAVCARATDQNVYCWGDDYLGEAGVFPIPANGVVATPTKIAGIAGDASELAMSATYGHGCALRIFGLAFCWGSNVQGELGHAKATAGDQACVFGAPCNPAAEGVTGGSGTALALGQTASCVRRGSGVVSCWGANDAAQLGNGTSVDSDAHPTPVDVMGLTNVVAVQMRFQTGYAIDGAAHVFAWGLASNGALGAAGATIACAGGTCAPRPVAVPTLDGAVQIAPTRAGGIARKSDGSVWVWGVNDLGQLGHVPGDGDATCTDAPCRETPAELKGLP